MVPNEVLHVKVRPKTRPPVYPDVTGHLEPQVRVSFASHHNVSPSFRRTHSATSPISSRLGLDAEAADSGLDSESTLSSTAASSSSKGRRSVTGGVPIVSVSGLRHRSRIKRQKSTPIHPGGDDSANIRSSFTISAHNTPPPYPGRVSATYEDVEWTLSHRRPSLNAVSDPSTHISTSEFTTAHENSVPVSSGNNGFTTPTRLHSPTSTGTSPSADNYITAKSDSRTAGDAVTPHTSPAQSPSPVKEPAAPALPQKEKDAVNPAGRRKKATKAMKATKKLFSPVAADQERKLAFPMEYPAAKP